MAEGGSSAGPPDLISDMVQPVDLVNSVTRPAVVSLGHQMPVDIVGDLPALPAGASPGAGGDTVGDQMDTRWFSRGTAASGGPSGGRLTRLLSRPGIVSFLHYEKVL